MNTMKIQAMAEHNGLSSRWFLVRGTGGSFREAGERRLPKFFVCWLFRIHYVCGTAASLFWPFAIHPRTIWQFFKIVEEISCSLWLALCGLSVFGKSSPRSRSLFNSYFTSGCPQYKRKKEDKDSEPQIEQRLNRCHTKVVKAKKT